MTGTFELALRDGQTVTPYMTSRCDIKACPVFFVLLGMRFARLDHRAAQPFAGNYTLDTRD